MPGASLRTDVLVLGGGNAALCAAISARRAGAEVTVVERAPADLRGGNSRYTRNFRCVHDDGDPVMTGTYDAEEFLADIVEVTGAEARSDLTRLTVSGSRELPEWMQAHGVRFSTALEGTIQVARTNRFFAGGGQGLMDSYYRAAEKLGIRILYETKAQAIHVHRGRCEAVDVECREGVGSIEVGALVAAAGGYEANREWLGRACGRLADNFVVRGTRYNDGLVLRCLLDAGARSAGPECGFHAIAVDARSPEYEGGIATRVDSIPFGIVVNRDGSRFYDEGEDLWPKRYATWGRLIAEQPGQCAYALFDDRVAGSFIESAWPPYHADSVAELSEQLLVPAANLAETINRYNAAVQPGTYDPSTLDRCRTSTLEPPKTHWALRIERPPFFAYPLRPGITFTYFGVAVDADARVRRESGEGFDNIFAAGEIMAGNILSRGYLAGLGMTIGAVFGRLAGTGAARAAGSSGSSAREGS